MSQFLNQFENPFKPETQGQSAQVRLGVVLQRLILLMTATLGVVFTYGFPKFEDMVLSDLVGQEWVIQNGWIWLTRLIQIILVAVYALDFWLGRRYGRWAIADEKPDKMDILTHGAVVLSLLIGLAGYDFGWHAFEIVIVCMGLGALWQLNVVLSRKLRNPGILLPASFFVLIFSGTCLLKLPLAVPPGAIPLSWLDALFTSTSAVCVTGLVVRDTATQFTPFGQTVIGVLIQMGGLGMIIFGAMLAMFLGSRQSLREHLSLSQMLDDEPLRNVSRLVRFIVLMTLTVELIGAMAAMPFWRGDLTFSHRVGLSLFHSVSAFCNAGFALFSDNLEPYRYSYVTHLVIAPLIVVGGLGYPVLNDLMNIGLSRIRRWRRKPAVFKGQYDVPLTHRRLSLHSKIVLTTTACVYLYGVVGIFASQMMPYISNAAGQNVTANRTVPEPLSTTRVGEMLADSSFMAITARTAGFNSMPVESIGTGGEVTVMTLMLVGGSPGGTAGGMKTATLALVLLSVWATVRQRQEVQAFERRIYDRAIRRATALAAAMLLFIVFGAILLSMVEPFPFIKLLFELISATTTTGLSLGITASLSAFGKLILILAMFLGRVGPLAFLGALVFRGIQGRPYALAHESVILG